MDDRVAAKPGRVLITPESGAPYYAVLTMADEPTQEGDPPTKVTLFTDATEALFAPDSPRTPNAAFALLSRLNAGFGNEYVWEKKESYVDCDRAYQAPLSLTGLATCYFWIADSFTIADGKFSLTNPTVISLSNSNTTNTDYVKGKYAQINGSTAPSSYSAATSLYYIPIDATFTAASSFLSASTGYVCTNPHLSYAHVSYVNSPSSDAYPPSVSDGYTYTALGQIGNKVQIAVGSYTGTGTYGSSNLNSLTLPFAPKRVSLISSTGVVFGNLVINGATVYGHSYVSSYAALAGSISGNTISWHNASSAAAQLNASGTAYLYEAEG